MKTIVLGLLVAFSLVALHACDLHIGYRYNTGIFPSEPINLGDINSSADDYNSDTPSYGNVLGLVFSSKRNDASQFDFVNEWFSYSFDRKSGKFSFNRTPYQGLSMVEVQRPLTWAAETANSTANELGPYIRPSPLDENHFGEYMMLFASDRTGNLDIYLTHNVRPAPPRSSTVITWNTISGKTFGEPVPLGFLNSPADDAYPTLNQQYDALYFTSNRAGTFDIYRALLPMTVPGKLHEQLATLTESQVERVADLSSAADDKCPYILDNWLVFTSNRPGGYGGFDLYYSNWTGGRWSAPQNFGPDINTAADEYRPILHKDQLYENQLMLFSSNRPGGKGGFDLYMIGIPK